MQDLYEEIWKTLIKDITEELNKWRDIPCSGIERLNIVKMSVLSNFIYQFNSISIKIPASYFVDNKLILKSIWRSKGPRITNTPLKEKEKVGSLIILNFKTHYKVKIIKTVWYWQKNS